jgi:hypothetical protein
MNLPPGWASSQPSGVWNSLTGPGSPLARPETISSPSNTQLTTAGSIRSYQGP